ncbi:MAG: zinc ribbon domain-containing protein [Phycisphaerales bacterium]|nr:zinc ribbon domain-containing protein [Phycisphaerales bacterium]
MKCSHCDQSIAQDSRFCKYCGAKTLPAAPPSDAKPGPDVHGDPKHEKAVWQGRPAWRAFSGAWLLWLTFSVACLFVAYQYSGADSALVTVVWLFAGGAAAALLVREALVVYGLRYQLTTQRLFVHRGILTRVTDQLELLRIDDVRLRQGVVDRLVNTGHLDIFGTDETDDALTLTSIPTPADVAESLRLHVHAVRSKGALAVERI